MILTVLPSVDGALAQTIASVATTGAARQTVDTYLDTLMLLAEQAADNGHYGLQDACLLLAEALSELLSNDPVDGDLPLLLKHWHSLAADYLNHPGTGAADIIAFLRQPVFNLAFSDDEFALLASQLNTDSRTEQRVVAAEPSPASENFHVTDEEQEARFEDPRLDETETLLQALPRATREIVQLLLLETAALENCLSEITADVPAATYGLQQLAEKTEGFGRVAQIAGFEGLARLCEHIAENVRHFLVDTDSFNAERQGLLTAWVEHVKAYLPNFSASAASQAMLIQLRNARWPSPLCSEDSTEILAQLQAPSTNLSQHAEAPRLTTASSADVSLALPDDVNQELLDLLLQDLPSYTLQFSTAVQRMQGGGNQQDLEVAQRVAHTLKGSANTVGIRGIAVLTHHLEDILLVCTNKEKPPGRALLDTLLEAADCLESMSESLIENSPPPANTIAILQQVLDWANRLDREGVDVIDSTESRSKEPSPEGEGWVRGNQNEEKCLFISPHPGLLPEGEEADSRQNPAPFSIPDPTTSSPSVRVPKEQIENLLRISGESVILNSQAAERQQRMQTQLQTLEVQFTLLQQLGGELERLIDVKDLSDRHLVSTGKDFDPLELDQYNELHTAGRRMVEAAVDARVMAQDLKKELEQMKELLEHQQRFAIDTQEAVLHTRLAPVASIAPRLQRALRQTCRLTGKQAVLVLSGENLLLDGDILNSLADPLMHLLRNAVDHGIESEDERLTQGKAPCGKISLAFERDGNHILVRCRDDGRGLDFAAIRTVAEKRGVLQPGQEASEEELQRFILRPTFSTRNYSTQTSGRGIGMDAVHAQVLNLGGTLLLHSSAGRGLSVELKLPLPLSRLHALLASVGNYRVAISSKGVEQILFGGEGEIKTVGLERMLLLGTEIYPLVKLQSLLQIPDVPPHSQAYGAILLVKNTDSVWAVQVDAITANREVVIKNLGYYVAKIPGIIGATITGDGRVTPVLDLPELLRAPFETALDMRDMRGMQQEKDDAIAQLATALIVDDSLSQRRALEQLLADAGFRIRSARDGIEAAELLAQFRPAIVLTDLEMPRMNGIELTAHIRAQAYGKTLPIIMITSRTTAKHRQMAEAAGVDGYLTKPVHDDELLGKIQSLLHTDKQEAYVS